MKKPLPIILAVIAVVAIIFGVVSSVNGNNAKSSLEQQIASLKSDAETAAAAASDELNAAKEEAAKAAEEAQTQIDALNAKVEEMAGEAEAAAEKESENGAEGFSFDDPATGVRFPMPEGWRLQEKGNGNYLFTDGTATLTLSTVDVWRRMGKSTQAQYMDAGYARETLNTDAFERSAFASAIGVAEEDMTEENINGALWLAAAEERNGETVQYRVGAVKGTVIIFAGAEGAAAETVKIMIETLTVD